LELPRAKFILTAAGYARLQEELEQLQRKRHEVAGNIRTAKGYGDLSENFEYHEAKREQGFVEGRIMELKVILPAAHVIRPDDVSTDAVGFGARVRIRDPEFDEEWDWVIVGPLEANPDEDRISYESPIGEALIGRKVGEVVEIEVPAGKTRYEIVGIDIWRE
jgi:transcription elongation factor GreA